MSGIRIRSETARARAFSSPVGAWEESHGSAQ